MMWTTDHARALALHKVYKGVAACSPPLPVHSRVPTGELTPEQSSCNHFSVAKMKCFVSKSAIKLFEMCGV